MKSFNSQALNFLLHIRARQVLRFSPLTVGLDWAGSSLAIYCSRCPVKGVLTLLALNCLRRFLETLRRVRAALQVDKADFDKARDMSRNKEQEKEVLCIKAETNPDPRSD